MATMGDLKENDRCPICLRPFTGRVRRVRDHDHLRDEWREELCSDCNAGLGFFRDDPLRLSAAAEYVTRHRSLRAQQVGVPAMPWDCPSRRCLEVMRSCAGLDLEEGRARHFVWREAQMVAVGG